MGNLVEERHPNENVVVHTYDDLNRLKSSVATPSGPSWPMTYDARGNRIMPRLTPTATRTENDYDALDRTVRATAPRGAGCSSFGYDVAGNTDERD